MNNDSSDSDDDNVFNMFKPGVKFDIIEDEETEITKCVDNFAPRTLPFLSKLERNFLKRNKNEVNILLQEAQENKVTLTEIELACLHLSVIILSGNHISLFTTDKDSTVESALGPAKAALTFILAANDVSKSTGLPDDLRTSVVTYICEEKDSYSRHGRALLCMLIGCVYLELYIQSNYTGPELSPAFYAALNLPDMEHEHHTKGVANLSIDGECAFRQCDIPHALILARSILSTICDSTRMLWEHGIELNDEGQIVSKQYPFDNNTLTAKQASSSLISRHLWSYRAGAIHLRVMQRQSFDSLPSLWKDSTDNLAATLTAFHCEEFCNRSEELSSVGEVGIDERCFIAQLWLENGLCSHYFDHGDKGRGSFQKAQQCARLITNLTGAIGKRTKHQVHSHAQMYLYARSRLLNADESSAEEVQAEDQAPKGLEDSSGDVLMTGAITRIDEDKVRDGESKGTTAEDKREGEGWVHGKYEMGKRMVVADESTGGEEVAVREVMLDDQDGGAIENILIEGGARFAKDELTGEGGAVDKGGMLHAVDQAVLLSLCLDVQNSNPADGLTSEEMLPYLHRVLEHPNNWMVHSTGLLERSWLEYEKRRTADRAMLQIQALLDQHTTKLTMTQNTFQSIEDASPVQDRIEYIHCLVYPAQYELKRDLAYKYLQSQVFVSALNMFQELELWDEVVKCYQLLQKPYRAEMVVREQLKKLGETPYMLTSLGDLTSDEDCYERAWTLSNGRFARAKRTLGHRCFTSNRFQQAIDHFDAALKVQPLVANAWYMRGLSCMRLNQFDDAILSFTRCVQQDGEIGEAWANIGAIYYNRGEYSKALSALKEGLKHKPNNFRILQNLVLTTIQLEMYSESCMYMHILVDIRHTSKQTDPLIAELRLICRGVLEMENVTDFIVSKFNALLLKVVNAYSTDAEVWDVVVVFKFATGNVKEGIENRFKQLRALVTKQSWETSEETTNKVLVISKLLVDEVLEHNSKENAYACRSFLTTIQRTFKAAMEINAQFSSKVTFDDVGSALSYDACLTTVAELMGRIESFEKQ